MTNARLTSAVMCFTGEIEGDRTSLVPWWSITKSILAAAVLKLAEADKLNLDQLYADWPAPSTHRGLTNYGGRDIRCVGRAIGHSGVGHDTVSAVYAFPDLPGRSIAAALACGTDEGISEHELVRRALNL